MNPSRMVLFGSLFIGFLVFVCPAALKGQMYRWIDKDGAVHFTDNPQSIPNEYKSRTEDFTPPPITTYEEESVSQSGGSSRMERNAGQAGAENPEESVRQLEDAIESLRSQIKAKRELIKYVDDRKNLAINPYRNRIITEKELDLYDRYILELPEDERELEGLEADLRYIQNR